MRPTWRVRHIDPVLCPRFLVSSFGGDVDIDAKAIIVEGELVDDQGVLVQNVHLATNTVVRLDQVSNKLNLIGRGWPLVQQPAVWENPRGRNAKHQKKYEGERRTPPLLSLLVGVVEELETEAGARSPEHDLLFLLSNLEANTYITVVLPQFWRASWIFNVTAKLFTSTPNSALTCPQAGAVYVQAVLQVACFSRLESGHKACLTLTVVSWGVPLYILNYNNATGLFIQPPLHSGEVLRQDCHIWLRFFLAKYSRSIV